MTAAFGDDGVGDAGDVWELMVREKGDVYAAGWGGPWLRDSTVRFKHVVTGQYLFSHRKTFNNGPVDGMNEVTGSPRADVRPQALHELLVMYGSCLTDCLCLVVVTGPHAVERR